MWDSGRASRVRRLDKVAEFMRGVRIGKVDRETYRIGH